MKCIALKTASGKYLQPNVNNQYRLEATAEEPFPFELRQMEEGVSICLPQEMNAAIGVYQEEDGILRADCLPNEPSSLMEIIELKNGKGHIKALSNDCYWVEDGSGDFRASAKAQKEAVTLNIEISDPLHETPKEPSDEKYNDATHRAIVLRTLGLLQAHSQDPTVSIFLRFASPNSPFTNAMFVGLRDADYKVPYIGYLYSSHFYDPETKRNFLGFGATALDNGRYYFDKSMKLGIPIMEKTMRGEPVSHEEMANCGYYLGIAMHYLTDLMQPMHAANFANALGEDRSGAPNILDKRHTYFEEACDLVTADKWFETIADYTKEDLNTVTITDPDQILIDTAKQSRDYFHKTLLEITRKKRRSAIQFDRYTKEEAQNSMEKTIRLYGMKNSARFLLHWMRRIIAKAHIVEQGAWYTIQEPTRNEQLMVKDEWIRRWKLPTQELPDAYKFTFVKNPDGWFSIVCKAFPTKVWYLTPTGAGDLHGVKLRPAEGDERHYKYRLYPTSDNQVFIQEATKDQVLAIGVGGGSDGLLIRWDVGDGKTQRMKLTKVK